MYPKSKSPSELKYERLRGMCSGAWENVRYIPIDNSIQAVWQGHGGIWLVLCVYRYTGSMAAGRHSRTEARDTNATRSILVYNIRYANTVYNHTTAITRASQRPGACIACARVRYIIILLYYYNIIILLYLYIPNISNISSIPSIPSIHNIPNISNNGNIAL